jgi:hypothetical protein
VEIEDIYIARAVLDGLDIRNGLGRRDWLVHIRASPVFENEPQTHPAPADRIPGQPVETSIEMHMNPIVKRARDYDICYRSSDATMAGLAKIDCDDDNVNRVCGRRGYPPFAELMVNYRLSQDQFPAPDQVSTDPSTESGAILQFDQRLREWLIGLERPR